MTRRIKKAVSRLSAEIPAGLLLLAAALVAVFWANSPWYTHYLSLGQTTFGPAALGLNLSLNAWAADAVLAVFFFAVGLELKQELTTGNLSNPKDAAVPVFAAVGGMIVPALIFVTVVAAAGEPSSLRGWAVPTATDIAFAVTIQALFGRGLPVQMRTFLLTLAVADDLLAIIVIAVFYAHGLNFLALAVAGVLLTIFALLVRLPHASWIVLLPLAVGVWYFTFRSGIHATISGVLLGLVTPARPLPRQQQAQTHRFARVAAPLSALVALPIFAFFASGVRVVGPNLAVIGSQAVFWAVLAGLVLGKFVGVTISTWLVTKLTSLRIPGGLTVRDLVPVAFLTGIGFTVALLVTELAFNNDLEILSAKAAILLASVCAGVLGAIGLVWDRHHRFRSL